MFDHTHYVPVLLTKAAEFNALKDLPQEIKAKMTPLFAVHPIDWDYEEAVPKKTLDEHIDSLGRQLAQCWAADRAFIDLEHVNDFLDGPAGEHPLTVLVNDAADRGQDLVPVVAPDRHPDYIDAAKALQQTNRNGVCFRLKSHQWPGAPGAELALEDLLERVEVGHDQVDLILDMRDHVRSDLNHSSVASELAALPQARQWRSLTLSGGASPKDLSNVEREVIQRITRVDWQFYLHADEQASQKETRRPTFGDYAIVHPDPSPAGDPRILNISGSLRYTVDNDWLVAKGGQFKREGGDAVIPAARLLAESDEFCGHNFSAGDEWIAQVAQAGMNGSNPQQWKRVAINHHLTFVTEQLAKRFDSSGDS